VIATKASRSGRLWASLIAAVLVLATCAACSGVPSTSDPQIIRSVGADDSTVGVSAEPPAPGADPRTIVEGFLAANVSPDVRHTNARLYLTPDAQLHWQDNTVTVVDDLRTGLPDPATGDVTVSARRVGTVGADGIYTSALRDPSGTDADVVPFTFGMKQADGEWRIDQLATGVIVSESDFEISYRQYPVYFFDSSESDLVPDMRYSATQGQSLATFLLGLLVDGPRPALSTMISELPEQPPASKPTVTVGTASAPTEVDLVSVRQLPAATLPKLAAQLAYTLDSVDSVKEIKLIDTSNEVTIPGRTATFSRADFVGYAQDGPASNDVLFIRDGAILSSVDGKPLPGAAGTPALGLVSIAQSSATAGSVAAVGVQGGMSTLYVGKDAASLAAVPGLRAPTLTRPTWSSHWNEVWVSDGTTLWRVAADGTVSAVQVTVTPGSADGTIVALRMSRDGTRLAVILNSGSSQALWIGTVVRTGAVRIDQLNQITPNDLRLTDVAWSDQAKLLVVGRNASAPATDFGIWSVQVDGSVLTERSTVGLPAVAPQSITAAPGQFAWISVENAVWEQRGGGWVAAIGDGSGTTRGISPAYED
jgi:hypothetical protein